MRNFSKDEVSLYLKKSLNVDSTDEQLFSFILERTEGNPFFLAELTRLMRETGYIDVHNCRAYLKEATATIPDRIHIGRKAEKGASSCKYCWNEI